MIAQYLAGEMVRGRPVRDLRRHPGRTPESSPLLTEVRLLSAPDGVDGAARMGAALSVQARFVTTHPIRPILAVTVKAANGAPIFGVSNRWTRAGCDDPAFSRGWISCDFPRLPLTPGSYMLDLRLADFGDLAGDLDAIKDAIALEVFPADVYGTGMIPRAIDGPVLCDASWSVASEE
jgi:hypothetical protein